MATKRTKLRDLGRKKSKEQIAARQAAAATQGFRSMREDLRLKAKAANERMRQLEKRGIKSPAYQSIQAQLEILGRPTKGDRGRRFSETGRATYNEYQILEKMLSDFLYEQKTSTVKGAIEYERDVWNSANKNNKLTEAGISKNEWLNFWASMPDRSERLYGSSQIVAIVRAYSLKNGQLEDKDKLSMQEIADEIQASRNLKDAYNKLGLDSSEVRAARIKRVKR